MGGPQCLEGKCRQDNLDLLQLITIGMHDRGIKYWLDFGGLLGVVREGDMIVGDDDMDLCATMEEFDKAMAYFDEINNDPEGLYFVERNSRYRLCGALLLYQVRPRSPDNAALLDLFFFEDDGIGGLRSMWTHEDDTTMDTIFPVQNFFVKSWGFSINIPSKPTDRLIQKYGENYMTPVSYKSTLIGKFRRGRNVFGRCMNMKMKYRNRYNILLIFLILGVFSVVLRFEHQQPTYR